MRSSAQSWKRDQSGQPLARLAREQGFTVENQVNLQCRSQISSLSPVFPGEVYDIRLRPEGSLRPGGGHFRPPWGDGNLGLRQAARGIEHIQGGGSGNLLGLRQRVDPSLLPAPAGMAPLLFRFGLKFGQSPMVATHGRSLSGLCRLRTWIGHNVILKPANFFADAQVLWHPSRLLPPLCLRPLCLRPGWWTGSTHNATS